MTISTQLHVSSRRLTFIKHTWIYKRTFTPISIRLSVYLSMFLSHKSSHINKSFTFTSTSNNNRLRTVLWETVKSASATPCLASFTNRIMHEATSKVQCTTTDTTQVVAVVTRTVTQWRFLFHFRFHKRKKVLIRFQRKRISC